MPICGCGTVYAVRVGEDAGLCDQCLVEEQFASAQVEDEDLDLIDDDDGEFDDMYPGEDIDG